MPTSDNTICSLQTEDEIALVQEEIRRCVDDIRAKCKPTQLAETRLEKRTYRVGVDLCRDNATYGLVDEVKQLYISKSSLEEKLRQNQLVFGRISRWTLGGACFYV